MKGGKKTSSNDYSETNISRIQIEEEKIYTIIDRGKRNPWAIVRNDDKSQIPRVSTSQRKQTRGWRGSAHCLSSKPFQSSLLLSFPDFSLVKTYFCILMQTGCRFFASNSPQNPGEFRNFGHAENKLGGMGFRGQSFPEHASLPRMHRTARVQEDWLHAISPAKFLRFCHIRRGDSFLFRSLDETGNWGRVFGRYRFQ